MSEMDTVNIITSSRSELIGELLKKYKDIQSLKQTISDKDKQIQLLTEGLEDKASIYLEDNNISGDTMVEPDHCINDNLKGSVYMADLMADFVKSLLSPTETPNTDKEPLVFGGEAWGCPCGQLNTNEMQKCTACGKHREQIPDKDKE